MNDAPLTTTVSSTVFRPWFGWVFFGITLIVATGVAVVIDRLRESVDACRRVQLELTALDTAAHGLSALEWETIHRGKLDEESSERLAALQAEIRERLNRLGRAESDLPRLEAFTQSYRTYLLLVDREFMLIAAAKTGEAEALDAAEVDPAFEALETALTAARDSYDQVAGRTRDQVRAGTFLVLLGGAGLIAGLAWQFDKTRHTVEVTAVAQRALRQTNAHLEARVRERTAELSTLNRSMEYLVVERTRELRETNLDLRREITEHTRAEEALRESEDRFRDLFENATDLIQIVSPDGHFLFVNRAWKQALGYTDEERTKLTALDIVDEGSKVQCHEIFRRLQDGEDQADIEAVLVDRQGRRITVEGAVTCRRVDGNPGNTRGMFRDVTARRQTEKTLQRLRDQHALILNSINQGVHGLALDGKITFENRASAAMLGYDSIELTGRAAHDIMHHSRPDGTPYPQSECPIHATLRDGLVRQVDNEVFWRKDGTSFPVEYTCTPMRDPDGTIVGTTIVFTDVTERTKLEARVRETQEQLMATSRQAGMADVATGMLHNVGNVLNSLNISASLIATGLRQSKADSFARLSALLEEHRGDFAAFLTTDPKGQRLPELVASLARYSLEERDRMLGETNSLQANIDHIKAIVAMQQTYAAAVSLAEPLDAVRLVEDALWMQGNAIAHHHIRIVRDFQPVHPVLADKARILQVLINLISNAGFACHEGGPAEKVITLSIQPGPAGRVRLIVRDNGIGITPENRNRIFAHGFTTRSTGHGFGLHSAANAAREMKGSLSVHSDGPGTGATFTLELPAAA